MKNKGFTLMELLAVIIILAIIALISVPLVLNTIEKARIGAVEASAYAYAEEVERYIILSEIDPTLPKLQVGVEYQLSSEKYEVATLADSATTYINDLVSIKGDKPTSGYLILDSEYKIEKMEMIINENIVECIKKMCSVSGKVGNTPSVNIVLSNEEISSQIDVKIKYRNLNSVYYKIGQSGEYVAYTDEFTLDAVDIVSNNLQNEDNTVTLYVKGTDSEKKEIEFEKVINNLDLDVPAIPIINVNSGHLKLTSNGVFNTTITYDDRDDIENYYSLDGGENWNLYTGGFTVTSGEIIAKSVKKETKLTVSSKESASAVASNALNGKAYDNNFSSYPVLEDYNEKIASSGIPNQAGVAYLYIDPSIYGKDIKIYWSRPTLDSYDQATAHIYNANGTIIATLKGAWGKTTTSTYTVPSTASYIKFTIASEARLYEVYVK